MLTAYQTNTKNLLQNPSSPTTLYDTTSLNTWINLARGQLAGESQCIRFYGTIATVSGQRAYNFSSIATGTPATNGIRGVIHVRAITVNSGTGQFWLYPRPFEWFMLYHMNNSVPNSGLPTTWAQYAQGSAGTSTGSGSSGSFYLDPIPDAIYTLNLDCVCYPIALTDDTTVEAIPYLWTDSVPFFAAYYALLSAQTNARQADAQRYFQHYQTFVQRARSAANPSLGNWMYEQAIDPLQLANVVPPNRQAAG
jgi:hypothetical protein